MPTVPPSRLERWLDRWADAHGGVARVARVGGAIHLTGADGAVVVAEPPFGPVAEGTTLLEHVARERLVGVLLVRLGGHAAGVFRGERLEASKVDRRLVHPRHRAGGQSANRFRRRRDNEERDALAQAVATAERVLVPRAADLEAVVTGGDRRGLARVLADPRLAALRPLVVERPVLDVRDPRIDVLERAPEQFLATSLREDEPA